MITFRTGGSWTPELLGTETDSDVLQSVQNELVDMLEARLDPKMTTSAKVKVVDKFISNLSTTWTKYSSLTTDERDKIGLRSNFIGTKTKGKNDFLNWAHLVIKGNTDALKVYNVLNN